MGLRRGRKKWWERGGGGGVGGGRRGTNIPGVVAQQNIYDYFKALSW